MKIILPLLFLLAMAACKSTEGNQSNNGDSANGGNSTTSLYDANGWSWTGKTNYILRIEKGGDFSLKLDVNNCFGQYKLSGGSLSFPQGIACTEMCCDEPEALTLTRALSKVSRYELKDNTLTLTGPEPALVFQLSNGVSNEGEGKN